MNKAKSLLFIVVHVMCGLAIVVGCQHLKTPDWLAKPVVVWVAFLLLNLALAYLFKLHHALKEYWSVYKIGFFPVGTVAGIMIALAPFAIGLLTRQIAFSDIAFKNNFLISSIAITLVIVWWEELWFKGIFLNYCNKYLSAVTLSVVMGILFMLIHVLNPDFNLLKSGPALFFAGALLTFLYVAFRNFWLPLGMHFGNNLVGSTLEYDASRSLVFGEDGYVSALILALIFTFVIFKTKSRFRLNLA